tara:strand:+ start:393 stop:581 length:189 start_codon:yes stop_codon:yes gene_type:complete
MKLNNRIKRKSFFKKLGLFSSGTVIAGYYTNRGLTGKLQLVASKLETRFKKPSNILQSDIFS